MEATTWTNEETGDMETFAPDPVDAAWQDGCGQPRYLAEYHDDASIDVRQYDGFDPASHPSGAACVAAGGWWSVFDRQTGQEWTSRAVA